MLYSKRKKLNIAAQKYMHKHSFLYMLDTVRGSRCRFYGIMHGPAAVMMISDAIDVTAEILWEGCVRPLKKGKSKSEYPAVY